ncbi:MAG TPA: diaminopimelate epimerase, partial [Planctomycetota bacterium]|nr:diaminopimelate epimerase [Planctomycetota bacterium]
MKFTKMEGLGNDYVYIDLFEEKVADAPALAVRMSDRHFGVGSDGLILIGPSERADARMEMYNADGSRAGMCGNGIRCVAKYVYEHGIARKETLDVETDAG